jgi:hypothetical protein
MVIAASAVVAAGAVMAIMMAVVVVDSVVAVVGSSACKQDAHNAKGSAILSQRTTAWCRHELSRWASLTRLALPITRGSLRSNEEQPCAAPRPIPRGTCGRGVRFGCVCSGE